MVKQSVDDYNQQLSEQRSVSVRDYLMLQGMPRGRVNDRLKNRKDVMKSVVFKEKKKQ